MTPLHLAALNDGAPEIIAEFVLQGALLEIRATALGMTPLQLAVARGVPATVTAFLDAGAATDVRLRAGESLLDLAAGNDKLNGSDVLLRLDDPPL